MIGIPKKTVSPKMTEWIDIISKEQNFPVKKAYLPIGAWTDANPFIEKGYETATFAGISTKIHSKGDNFDIIDEENLFKAYVMGIELAKKINER
jgi:putative aminopeptidase FrvX